MKICFKNIGIIVIHGFGGNTKDVEPISKKLDSLGYMVVTPLLAGHTGLKKDFKKTTYHDWVADVENAYLSLSNKCDEIVLIGFSMGGLLSLQVANKHKVKGIITLNTPIYIGNFLNFMKKIFHDLIKFNFNNLKQFYQSFIKLPFNAYLNFNRLLHDTKKILPNIKCDILVNQAINDEVVRFKSAHFLHNHVNSLNKKLMFYKKSNHLILQSEIAEDVIVDLVKYIENFQLNK